MSRAPVYDLPRLMLIFDCIRIEDPAAALSAVERACAAGLGWIQLRDKQGSDAAVAVWMQALDRRLPAEVRRSVNGRPALAGRFGWELHLPGEPAGAAPRAPRPIGRSVHSPEETRRAVEQGADYLIAGTLFATASKPGRPGIGTEGLEPILQAAAGLPVFGVGGIDAGTARAVRRAGAWGVCVFGAILQASDPAFATRELLDSLSGA